MGALGTYSRGTSWLTAFPRFSIFFSRCEVGARCPPHLATTTDRLTDASPIRDPHFLAPRHPTFAAFLNKKSWHTGGMPMQAEVWKREQEKAHEDKKMEEMKKEIAEERKMQEFTEQAAAAGHFEKIERLEFMYKGGPGMGGPGMSGTGVPSEDSEAYLLGEKKFQAPEDAPGSLLGSKSVGEIAKNEQWNKLNADPLLAMRVQEREFRVAIEIGRAHV
jgi:hypothetical protein